ncbi:DUF342 domain-containing protein [Alteromonas lipolytica]|uniref:Flagellar Assembly Protein A N-terminal region domain-containing protein n=1 Tax=Alteromonas lipolytica TaxID=1856405 RepID=A0A1E8FIQ7_9ALTE|nr:FapA family protein [Alteromonas lipolytica]OFI35774.1 hypothetical protein BFC17_10845 [Alteromonas lipolytica]GGF80671.1 hypothetical protein GCM10011338_36160 [Alteromonas lipolytica]
MQGVNFSFDENREHVTLTISPGEMSQELSAQDVHKALCEEGYDEVYLSESAIKSACDKANHLFKTRDSSQQVIEQVGERRHTEVEFRISEDNMSAFAVLTAPHGGQLPSASQIMAMAKNSNIRRGIGRKRISALLDKVASAKPGTRVESLIAKGLPPRDGRPSKQVPLVPNALERVLRPQAKTDKKVDLRNLGEIVCVKAGAELMRREQPGRGRHGFDVRGNTLPSKVGDWVPFNLGNGTAISDHDENLLVSTIAGMPKYQNMIMTVDDTFICQGVNVGTGHITYEGSVLVNGDVTENMIIKAKGDVTINGFAESAHIQAEGDIIITEGAMGKQSEDHNEYTCTIQAGGSVYLQHGQGLDIIASANLNVARQLAHCRVMTGGQIIVGQPENPQGNLFACEISSHGPVIAGTVGAVSGSTLRIDFSAGFNQLQARKDSFDELLKQLRGNTERHKQKMDLINNRVVPKSMIERVDEAKEMLKNESNLLTWMEGKAAEMTEAKHHYQESARLVANKKLYSGVSVKLNNRNWRSEREYERAKVSYEMHQWKYEPLV